MAGEEGERTVGSYRLIKRIGAGGMGVVYHGQHRRIGRDAAIKILPLHLAEDPDFLKRFEREAASVASLQHPNILPVWEYGEHEGSPYLVMPYIRGGTLRERLLAKPLTHEEVSRYLEQIADALDYAHSQGIIHRDVKPANLLLTERGHLYLADFGIAKVLESAEGGLTRTGVGIGTPEYIAPEQAHGRAEKRSDLYALGIILYQMLTGRVPYSGNSALDTMLQHMNTPLPTEPLQQLPPASAQAITAVLVKATQKDPEARYQSGRELAEAFALASGQARQATIPAADRPTSQGLTPLPPMTGAGYSPTPGGHPSGMTPPPPLTPLPPSPHGMQATVVSGMTPPPGMTPAQGMTPPPGTTPPPGMSPLNTDQTMIQRGATPLPPSPLAPHPSSPSIRTPTPQAPAAPPARRSSPVPFVLGGVAVLLVIGAIAFFALRGGDPPSATATIAAVVPSAAPSITPTTAPTTAAVASSAAVPSASAPASSAPTSTATQPAAVASTSAQPPSAAPSAVPTPALAWQTYTFSSRDTDESAPNNYRVGFDQPSGEARITLNNSNAHRHAISDFTAGDFALEVDVRKLEGPPESFYGIAFRIQRLRSGQTVEERYTLLIRQEGQVTLLYEAPGASAQVVRPVEPLPSPLPIQANGATNRLSITCRGEQITVAINGQPVGTFQGTLVSQGGIGLVAQRNQAGATVVVGFSNLRYATLP
jgi:serine/threonine protein kinase